MSENNLIKTFINKAITFTKYTYYAKKSRESGFFGEADAIESIAQNQLFHAFSILDKLGYDECADYLDDMIADEKREIEKEKSIMGDDASFFITLSKIDAKHLSIAEKLKNERNSDLAYKEKRCALCGYKDKSGKILEFCPQCMCCDFR